MNCPWCGAKPAKWDGERQRGEWACGSAKHGRDPCQFDSCRINVLEVENAELRQQRDEWEETSRRLSADLVQAIDQRDEAVKGLEATLLFHSATPWSPEKKRRWQELTCRTEATTKILCDTIRGIIIRVEAEQK